MSFNICSNYLILLYILYQLLIIVFLFFLNSQIVYLHFPFQYRFLSLLLIISNPTINPMDGSVPPEIRAFIENQVNQLKSQVQSKDKALSDLREQLDEMKMRDKSKSKSSSSSKIPKASPSPKPFQSSSQMETPTKSSSRRKSAPSRSQSTPIKKSSEKKQKTPTPKRNPLQISEEELPANFRPIRVCHIASDLRSCMLIFYPTLLPTGCFLSHYPCAVGND